MQIRVLILALALILLSGCANTEPTPSYLREPVPQVWTDTFTPPELNGTYGDYMAQCELIIQQCNADRTSVRRWSDEATEEVEK
ncbi:Rz1-like lysis system protein LysC [Marinobacterium iners]|uniref:Rz1-like lysis system protein LysC n=1 Tax=Marinobacterium iners TaxID=48076 RepID=UPI003CC6013E